MGSPGIPRIPERFAALSWAFLLVLRVPTVWDPPGSLGFPTDLQPLLGLPYRVARAACVGSPGILRIPERFAALSWAFLFVPRVPHVWDPPGSLGFPKDLQPSLGPCFSIRPCLCVEFLGIPKISQRFAALS